MKLQKSDYDKLIDMALAEDLGDNGDVTTDSIFTEPKQEHYRLVAKEDGVYRFGEDVFTVGRKDDLFYSVCSSSETEIKSISPKEFLSEVASLSDAQI